MTEINTPQSTGRSQPPDPGDSPADRLAPARRANLQVVELDGEVSLYDPTGNNAVTLNGTASAIWRRLDGRTTVSDLVGALAEEFGTTSDRIAPDVEATLTRLGDLGLLA